MGHKLAEERPTEERNLQFAWELRQTFSSFSLPLPNAINPTNLKLSLDDLV